MLVGDEVKSPAGISIYLIEEQLAGHWGWSPSRSRRSREVVKSHGFL